MLRAKAQRHETRFTCSGTKPGPCDCSFRCKDRDEAGTRGESKVWMVSWTLLRSLDFRQWGSIKDFEQGRKPGKTFMFTLAIR